jgi:hypothetical protein
MMTRIWPILVFACLLVSSLAPAQACTAVPWPLTSAADRLGLSLDGQVRQAWSCRDAQGEHVVLTMQLPTADGTHSQIQFVKYSKVGSRWKRDWLARDFLPIASVSTPPVEIVLLKDVDGDGVAETFVAYTLPGRVGEPDTGKLLVYYKDRKYAIRGAVARTADDFGSQKVDEDFETLPAAVRAQAFQLWDRLSQPAPAARNWVRRVASPSLGASVLRRTP